MVCAYQKHKCIFNRCHYCHHFLLQYSVSSVVIRLLCNSSVTSWPTYWGWPWQCTSVTQWACCPPLSQTGLNSWINNRYSFIYYVFLAVSCICFRLQNFHLVESLYHDLKNSFCVHLQFVHEHYFSLLLLLLLSSLLFADGLVLLSIWQDRIIPSTAFVKLDMSGIQNNYITKRAHIFIAYVVVLCQIYSTDISNCQSALTSVFIRRAYEL